jgi:hypothetical protein
VQTPKPFGGPVCVLWTPFTWSSKRYLNTAVGSKLDASWWSVLAKPERVWQLVSSGP